MSDQEKVLFADVELSIHQANPVDGSKTLLPGQFIALADLMDYQSEAASAGNIPGARVMDKRDAELLQNEAARNSGVLVEEPEVVYSPTPEELYRAEVFGDDVFVTEVDLGDDTTPVKE